MRAWLTPDTESISVECFQVYLPDIDTLRAAFFGAFLLLCDAGNWEQFGTMTPEEAAALFNDAWLLTVPPTGNLQECVGSQMSIPIGTILSIASDNLPSGCLWCDGSYYATSAYPALFEQIGYVWGQSGTDFAVPNMCDAYPKGAGTEDTLGDRDGTNDARQVPVPAHTHQMKKAAASGSLETAVSTGIRWGGDYIQTESEGSTPAMIGVEGRRVALNFYIVAE